MFHKLKISVLSDFFFIASFVQNMNFVTFLFKNEKLNFLNKVIHLQLSKSSGSTAGNLAQVA